EQSAESLYFPEAMLRICTAYKFKNPPGLSSDHRGARPENRKTNPRSHNPTPPEKYRPLT
ncbi:hypothetical protein, partial [Klebsiella michiganensis]|uniref:hypothetical protein n=1 Tax=Klebsiella michiganensis TaxID=1134687 RepID=UPI0035DA8032